METNIKILGRRQSTRGEASSGGRREGKKVCERGGKARKLGGVSRAPFKKGEKG